MTHLSRYEQMLDVMGHGFSSLIRHPGSRDRNRQAPSVGGGAPPGACRIPVSFGGCWKMPGGGAPLKPEVEGNTDKSCRIVVLLDDRVPVFVLQPKLATPLHAP